MSDGILLIDKPSGCTSTDVVRQVKRAHRFASIGHVGTLDPMATGLLPLCVGRGTRIAQFLSDGTKEYLGRVRLGIATDTLDVTGKVTERAAIPTDLSPDRLAEVARQFLGDRLQTPPMFSAVKKDGRRLYDLAREGIEVAREARPVRIERLELVLADAASEPEGTPDPADGPTAATAAEAAAPELALRVTCSKGTYVRVLADEIARALGTVGTLSGLRRTRVDALRVEDAIPLAAALAAETSALPIVSTRQALAGLPSLTVAARTAWAVAAGRPDGLRALPPAELHAGMGPVTLVAPGDRLLAVVESSPAGWVLRRVLLPEALQLYSAKTPCYPQDEEKTEEERWR